jgi:conjugative transfer signal peptidase TraF
LAWPPRPALLWNASASSPIGLYAVTSPIHLRVGDTVAAWPPPKAQRLAAERRYLPASVPLVKRVAAISGDRVCALGRTVLINGRPMVVRQRRDLSGRRLPWWSGCAVLRAGDLFLLSPHARNAFDGRYFGLTRSNQLIGKARLLWPR